MASEVGIVNSAGTKIGAKNLISSFDEGTPLANLADNRYAEIRDELLRSHPWNFAVKRAKLARLAETPTFEFDYAYSMPTGWIRTIWIANNDQGDGYIEYREEDNKILSDEEEIYMKYITQVTDPNIMTPDFRELIAMKLAIEGAISIVNSNTLSELWQVRYDRAWRKATSIDSLSDRPDRRPHGSWVVYRFRSSGINTDQ